MNVVVIVNDTLRWDYLGCYGNEWIKTPNLDKLASESAVFDYGYAEGLPTIPTRTTFFTGRFTFPFRGWQRLEPTDILLAEVLWNKGYTNALVTDVYHMHKPTMAFERGFDFTQHIRGHEADPWVLDESIAVDVDRYHKAHGRDKSVRTQIAQYLRNIHWWQGEEDTFVARCVRSASDWLTQQPRKDNLFLWLDCFDPHEPWDPPEPYRSMYRDPAYTGRDIIHPIPGRVAGYLTEEELHHIKMLYAGKVSLCDHWMGVFLNKLRELGMYDNTLIIFTSDHGAPFGEHGIIKKAEPLLFEELVHIPLIIRHPEGTGAGRRFDALVETTEVFPTILDFLDVRPPPRVHGKSLLPLMAGETESIRDYAYMGYYKQSWRINDHDWSFMMYLDRKTPAELYHLSDDPREKNNVIAQNPSKAMELELELRKFVANLR
ncbi:MAG: sulfatase-like hydrolase/transferase [bacterium]|nr:sulfatase-like hydrolase/transferase [bacterium]